MAANKNETLLFFPTVVREIQIADAKKLNETIDVGIDRIRSTEPNSLPATWSCDLYTTIGSPTTLVQHEEFEPLREVIMREANDFANALELEIDRFPLKFTECWLNIYGEGHAQEVHHHSNAVISGIYYAKAPAGSGDLLIHSPYMDIMLDPPTRKSNGLNVKVMPITPKEGKMILFQSFVKHSVKPTRGASERISIAFNLTM
ncbi:MAG: 2OG-Fe(II) oxygenase family protein [Hyphomicrobiaceae bacterium]|nr:2OG-Fe(II) oxygenase family protein [Hyphomicrobiaceae bacterium]